MTVLAQQALSRDIGVFEFLLDGGHWTAEDGILDSLVDTVVLCAAVLATAAVIAIPLGAVLAHQRRGELLATGVVNVGRAVPSFAVGGLLVPVSLDNGWGFEPWPIFITLTLLALPGLFLTTYTAVSQADPVAVDAARGMGFSERSVLARVELALAVPIVVTGLRVTAVQVVATEPIRAFLGGNGLGRYVRDGLGQNNDGLVVAGAILVALLATGVAAGLALLERVSLPSGVRRIGAASIRRTGAAPS